MKKEAHLYRTKKAMTHVEGELVIYEVTFKKFLWFFKSKKLKEIETLSLYSKYGFNGTDMAEQVVPILEKHGLKSYKKF